MAHVESIAFVSSDITTQFTDSLAYGASEYEDLDLTGTGGVQSGEARCFVTSLRLITAQNNAWMVTVHDRASTYDSINGYQLNNNTLIDFWQWTAAQGVSVGTVYVYSVSGMKIPYRDRDGQGRLHVALHNQSTTSKIQGTGYAHLKVGVIDAA